MRNQNQLLAKIIKHKISCVFVSPHFDDVALSCGGLISYLSDKTTVVVINVFTQADKPPYTLSAKKFLRISGYKSADNLFEDRKVEDANALKDLNVRVFNLGYIDALWRKKSKPKALTKILGKLIPESTHIYSTFRFHIAKGKVSPRDRSLVEEIRKRLTQVVEDFGDVVIFSPLAIGSHVDHILVRNACNKLRVQKVFWADYPYSLKSSKESEFLQEQKLHSFSFNENQRERLKLISSYKTQISGLFPDGKIYLIPEFYFWRDDIK